ncbi:MAG: monovalent cation:proton antiporter-2 (CPA2) family protein [Cardiobacteriaceae bacterium]|nr:monovalent cation:proton antiporter-2 (CPA2) family protein [Cardiobacteriaceae bacterium]
MVDTQSLNISVIVLLGTAMIAVPLFKKLGLGSVLGYLAGGVVIGPFGLGFFNDGESIIHFAELGVVMFLFLVGLEMNPMHLWKLRKNIFGLGLSQVFLACGLMTFWGVKGFGLSLPVAFVCAASFSLSSSAMVMQLLGERNQMNQPSGQRIFSILLFEDLMIVPLLAMVAWLAPLGVEETNQALWQTVVIDVAAMGTLLVAGKFVLNPLFSLLAAVKSREIMTAAALFVVLGAAMLMELAGLSMEMGAFVAGVLLSESSFRHQLEADIEPFRGLLLGLFFLGVGMSLDLEVVANNGSLIAKGVFGFMLAKALCVFTVAKLAKNPTSQAIERAVMMAHGGEFAFVLLASAFSMQVLSADIRANMTAIIVLSMAMMSVLVAFHQKWVAPRVKEEKVKRPDDEIHEENPILLIGMGRFGQIVSDVLLMSGKSLTIIDKSEKMVDSMTRYGVKTHFGDGTRPEILKAGGIEKAQLLIVATENKYRTSRIVSIARKLNPEIKILARAFDRPHTYDLHALGANSVVREVFDSAVRTGKTALEMLGMDEETSRKISELYFRRDRHSIFQLVEHYDPHIDPFHNHQMIEKMQQYDAVTKKMIEGVIHGEEVLWVEDMEDEEPMLPPSEPTV